MKCLIAVNSNGAACFISEITFFSQGAILNYINTGGSLLADIRFTVQDLLTPRQATAFIPPFLGKRATFTKE